MTPDSYESFVPLPATLCPQDQPAPPSVKSPPPVSPLPSRPEGD